LCFSLTFGLGYMFLRVDTLKKTKGCEEQSR
jgi:hypothetical protein